jgi:recombination endonuclease VII
MRSRISYQGRASKMLKGTKHSAATRARLRASMAGRAYRPIECAVCGSQFVPDHSRRTTCGPACKHERQRRVERDWLQTPSGKKSIAAFNSRRVRMYADNPQPRRDEVLRSSYGITRQEWGAILGRQEGRCAICADVLDKGKGTHIDHCHATGIVRGLLCGRCNVAIGMLKDNSTLLRAAARYVEANAQTVRMA